MSLPKPFYIDMYCINCGKSSNQLTCCTDCKSNLEKIRAMIKQQKEIERLHPKAESARRVKIHYTHDL